MISLVCLQIYGVALDSNTTHPIIDMASNLPARDAKKGAKLYAIASPLLHPEVCAAATNAGVCSRSVTVDWHQAHLPVDEEKRQVYSWPYDLFLGW